MATVTWQGDDLTNPTYWNDADNWDTGTVPANGDDVVLSNAANCNVNANTANLKSFDMTGYTGTLSGTSAITVIGAASSTVSVKFAGTVTWTGNLNLNPTAADTNIEFTSGGKTFNEVYIAGNGSSNVYCLDGFSQAGGKYVRPNSGNFHSDGLLDNLGLTHNWNGLLCTGGGGYLYAGNSTINLTTGGGTNAIRTSNGFNVNWGTSTVNMTGSGNVNIISTFSMTFNNFTRTGTAAKTDYLTLDSSHTVNGALAFVGNSPINRLLVSSNTLGTARTITLGASATFKTNSSNFDLRDITMTGGAAGELDCSGAGINSGNCGGNSNITFTTADNWYFYDDGAGTFNFSDYTQWYEVSGGTTQMASTRCVLPQDDAFFDASSINGAVTVDQDMPRVCRTLDFTGVDAVNFHMNNVDQTIYGGLILANNVTLTINKVTIFESVDRSGSYNFNSSGKTFSGLKFNAVGGTVILTANLTSSDAINGVQVNNGTFDCDTYDFSLSNFNSNNSNARTILMGSGSWSVTTTVGGSAWNTGTITNLTNPATMGETSTLNIGYNGANNQTFTFGAITLNNLNIVGGSTQSITLVSSSTFNTFTINAPKTVKFTASTNTTVADFVATGTGANHIVIASVTASSPFTLTKSGGGTCVNDYLDVTDSNASPASTFYFGANGSGDAYSLANGWDDTAGGVATGWMSCNKGFWNLLFFLLGGM